VGNVKLAVLVFLFWERLVVRETFTLGYLGKVLEYEIEELKLLFKKFELFN
jgi:hypothetical protein